MAVKIFHVSEDPSIAIFNPRPSPQAYEAITGHVVFGISDKLLHNYMLPRNCPRVCYYALPDSHTDDVDRFFKNCPAKFIMIVEEKWRPLVQEAVIYCYELPAETFSLLDEIAGYYVSYQAVTPLSITPVTDITTELARRNVELRFMTNLWQIAEEVEQSSLGYSIIRMRNALPR